MYQDDVPSAFLRSNFETGIEDGEGWMEQPEGFDDVSGRLCRLKKCIYGLKQSPREFNNFMHQFLSREGFKANPADHCIYLKYVKSAIIVVAVYVDDIISAGTGDSLTSFRQKRIRHGRWRRINVVLRNAFYRKGRL